MSRKVTQVSPQTVIKQVSTGKRDTFWVSGLKFDNYADSEIHHVTVNYLEPQEVRIELDKKRNWQSEISTDRIVMVFNNSNKPKMRRNAANQKGVKFFKTQKEAERHFLYAMHSMYRTLEPVLRLHKMYLEKLTHESPEFVIGI